MPLFYDTASPTPTSRNTINSVSIDIRDFLLQKNLLPTYPTLSTSLNGSPRIGQPVLDTETNFLNFYPQQRLEGNTSSLDILGSILNGQGVGLGAGGSIEPNFDVRGSLLGRVLGSTGILSDTKIGTIGAKQLALALANNAAFNVQQEILGTLNIQENIYSLIKDGSSPEFRPSYKITVPKSTGGQILNGITRVLGFQIPRSYLDESGSIFQTENGDAANIVRANAMIENTGKGQVKSLIASMLNNLSANEVNGSVEINPFRSGYSPAFNDKKGEPMSDPKIYAYYLTNGQGTVNGGVSKLLGNIGDYMPSLSYLREQMTSDSGFKSPEELFIGTGQFFNSGYDKRTISRIGFSWASEQPDAVNSLAGLDNTSDFEFLTGVDTNNIKGDKKSLLVKTQKLFNSKGMKNIVTVKGDMEKNSTQIQTANGNGFSKGSAVLKAEMYDLEKGIYIGKENATADETYCRSWTTLDRYDSVRKLIRKKALYTDPNVAYRFQTQNSVLDGPFVKIAPYANEIEDPKKFMLSIENLAWKDEVQNLPECEQGPGDLISGEKGRIMWFPPYDIQFSENNTVNWEETNFIGRGEPIYTYNNTKRSGNLSFKIVVDHPSYYNAFNARKNQTGSPDDNYIASFFAGCVDVDRRWADKLMSKQNVDKIVSSEIKTEQKRESLKNPAPAPKPCNVYFLNDVRKYNPDYEDGYLSGTTTPIDYNTNTQGEGQGVGYYKADITQKLYNGITRSWLDNKNFGLNAGRDSECETSVVNDFKYNGYNDPNWHAAMVEFLKSCPWAVVNVTGYASPQGFQKSNERLADLRADGILETLKSTWGSQLGLNSTQLEQRFKKIDAKPLTEADTPGCVVQTKSNPNPPTDTKGCKLGRKVEISIVFDENLKAEIEKSLAPLPLKITYSNTRLTGELKNKFYTECDYFERLTENDPFVFDSIREKIRYFHPAFHSTTPEGLNSRLTFLLQCTRQGPTLEKQGANNLAFGRPPVCILRIGDFYNTKIVIDNINISYEPLVWDLNPEGVGVQPMIANVDITFNFLGGSTLMGPLNKLQNALSFNYFANTHVYDPRADYISKERPTMLEKDKDTGELVKVPVPVNPTGYYINDGVSYKEYTDITNKLTKTDLGITDQPLGQIKDEAFVNSGPQNNEQTQDPTSIDDAAIVNKITVLNYTKYNFENPIIDLHLTYNSINGVKLNLTPSTGKQYKGQVYIINEQTKLNIGYITVSSDSTCENCGVIIKANGNPDSAGYSISPDIENGNSFNIGLNLEDNGLNNQVNELYNKTGSNLKLEWETNGTSNINFNNNNGI
jgi:hypothetical protein